MRPAPCASFFTQWFFMGTYLYKARDPQGALVSGEIQAGHRQEAVAALRGEGMFLLDIRESSPAGIRGAGLTGGDARSQLVGFSRQLSHLLQSGVPLARALVFLERQVSGGAFGRVVARVREDVSRGAPFWEALAKHPAVFSDVYVNTVRAGESGADLQKVMAGLAAHLERMRSTRNTLLTMLTYPLILLAAGMGTLVFLLVFVIPRMSFLFTESGESLPAATRLILFLSGVGARYGLWILTGVLAAAAVGLRCATLASVRGFFDGLVLRLPLVGGVVKKILFARIANILGLLLDHGVSILEALRIAQGVASNRVVAAQWREVSQEVTHGTALHESLRRRPVFPVLMADMVSVGEETGRLSEVFLEVAAIFDEESREETRRLLGLFEPAVIFFLAVAVGFLVMGILQPILRLNLEAF